MPGLGRCLVPGGYLVMEGCLVPGGVGIPACTEADHPPPRGETATAADSTHPTEMHSCFKLICIFYDYFAQPTSS